MHRFSLFVLGLLSLGQTALAAGPDAPAHLALWRSYTGVTWQQRVDAHSVNAPIAGLHFDAAGRAFVSTPRLISTQARHAQPARYQVPERPGTTHRLSVHRGQQHQRRSPHAPAQCAGLLRR